MSSTELFDAASNSKILKEKSSEFFDSKLFIFFARIRAQEVFPTPLGPEKSNACGSWFVFKLFFNVW